MFPPLRIIVSLKRMFKLIMSNLSNKTIIIDLNEVRISIYSFIISLQFKIIIIKGVPI